MYTLFIDEVDVCKKELRISKRPAFPSPIRGFNSYDIAGRNGTLYEDLETYSDIDVEIEFNYVCSPDKWQEVFRNCKRTFLNSSGCKVRFSDDLTFYRKIKKAVINVNSRVSIETGTFSVVFTLDPFCYAEKGNLMYPNKLFVNDEFEVSFPTFHIKGEGMCTLNVNGYKMKANIGQNLMIDTDKMLCYKTDGEMQNTRVSGNYSDMVFVQGINRVEITSGFELLVQPNWRSL